MSIITEMIENIKAFYQHVRKFKRPSQTTRVLQKGAVKYRFTNDPSLVLERNPFAPSKEFIVFYQLKTALGPFEVRKVIETTDGPKIVVYAADIHEEFQMPQKWFQYLFEPVDVGRYEFH